MHIYCNTIKLTPHTIIDQVLHVSPNPNDLSCVLSANGPSVSSLHILSLDTSFALAACGLTHSDQVVSMRPANSVVTTEL